MSYGYDYDVCEYYPEPDAQYARSEWLKQYDLENSKVEDSDKNEGARENKAMEK